MNEICEELNELIFRKLTSSLKKIKKNKLLYKEFCKFCKFFKLFG